MEMEDDRRHHIITKSANRKREREREREMYIKIDKNNLLINLSFSNFTHIIIIYKLVKTSIILTFY
jgi:hypothetical protein